MAHFDEIGEYALDQVLTRRLTTPGGSVAPTVAPELFGTLVLENDRPEWGYLKGERYCARSFFKAAVAAQYNMFQFYLPTTAKELVVIELIQNRTAQSDQVARMVGIGGGLGGWAAVATATRDTRYNGDRTSLIVESNNNVALPTRFQTMWQFSSTATPMDAPIIIAPGGCLCISSNGLNTDLSVNVAWRERGAQPGELV